MPRGAAASSLQLEPPDEPMEESNIKPVDPSGPVEEAVAGSDAVE